MYSSLKSSHLTSSPVEILVKLRGSAGFEDLVLTVSRYSVEDFLLLDSSVTKDSEFLSVFGVWFWLVVRLSASVSWVLVCVLRLSA